MEKINRILMLIIFMVVLVGCNANSSTTNEIYNKTYDVNISIAEFEDLIVAVGEKCDKGTIGVTNYGSSGVSYYLQSTGSGFIYKGEALLINGQKKNINDLEDSDQVVEYNYYAITNYHVIENASVVMAYFGEGFEEKKAKVLAVDKAKDIAVILFYSDLYLTPLELGNSDNLKKGQFTISIGSPGGYIHFNSLTFGVISSPNRLIEDEYGENLFIQVDVSLNPGNSGGPLINLNGEVIGVNTMKIIYQNYDSLGFSIPINVVKEFLKNNNL